LRGSLFEAADRLGFPDRSGALGRLSGVGNCLNIFHIWIDTANMKNKQNCTESYSFGN